MHRPVLAFHLDKCSIFGVNQLLCDKLVHKVILRFDMLCRSVNTMMFYSTSAL